METLQPKLRFSEFNEDWKDKELGNIFKITAGGDIGKENVSQIKNEIFKYPIYANAEKNKGFYGYSDIYKVVENVITVAGRGVNIGIAHARDHKFYPIVRLLVLIPKKNENIYFFEYQINRLNLFKESTGVPQLTAPQVSGYKVFYPQLSEQTKIANFLSAIDTKINQLTQKKNLLEQYKKGIMQKIFSQELRFKDDNGKDFPQWIKKVLSEIFDYKKGSGLSKEKLDINGCNKCVLYGELYTKYNEVIVDVISKTNSNEGLLSESGDLLIPSSTTTSGIDLANVTALKFDNILLGGDITVLRSNQQIDSVFYAYYLSNHKKKEIASYAQGITIIHLYYSHIKEMILDFPVYEEQTKIANFLFAIDDKINKVSNQLEKTNEYKKGLLQQMFV